MSQYFLNWRMEINDVEKDAENHMQILHHMLEKQ
jgi:hypothetical protein